MSSPGRVAFQRTKHVLADYRKWPDVQHYHFRTETLGEDEHGHWLGMRAGDPYEGPRNGTFLTPNVPLYVDICAPARWELDRVVTIDLDLDLISTRDGHVELLDEDEFAIHRVQLGCPAWAVAGALRASATVRNAIEKREAPFDGVHERWLQRLASEP